MNKTVQIKISDLRKPPEARRVRDIDEVHVGYLQEVLRSGTKFKDTIIVDENTYEIVDGLHRLEAYTKYFTQQYKGQGHDKLSAEAYALEEYVDVVLKPYATPTEMYLDALRYNAQHGKPLTGYDRKVALQKGIVMGIAKTQLYSALSITEVSGDKATSQVVTSTAQVNIPLKSGFLHMKGRSVSAKQADYLQNLAPGQKHGLLIQQLTDIISHNMVDLNNLQVLLRLEKLYAELKKMGLSARIKALRGKVKVPGKKKARKAS